MKGEFMDGKRAERSGWDRGFIELEPITFWGLITGGDIWSPEEKAEAVEDLKRNLLLETWGRMTEAFSLDRF